MAPTPPPQKLVILLKLLMSSHRTILERTLEIKTILKDVFIAIGVLSKRHFISNIL
jgi:hypothetical protein